MVQHAGSHAQQANAYPQPGHSRGLESRGSLPYLLQGVRRPGAQHDRRVDSYP